MAHLIVLGGAEEIGANSTYVELDGTGILIDAGLHPRARDLRAFPQLNALDQWPTDALIVTHAHTDHMGGVPYVLRRFPHLRTVMTRATRDLSHVMLHNNARLLRSDVSLHFPAEALEFYQREQIELLRQSFEAVNYTEPFLIRGYTGRSDVAASLHFSGHILGSAGVVLENKGLRILHTGDVHFRDQRFLKGARLPRTHADIVITEATNGADEPVDVKEQIDRLATFINEVTTKNGSVLIPCFALGKTQEMLTLLHSLMRRGTIPQLPIYSGGMSTSINKVYDHFCYEEPTKVPGFEVSDILMEHLTRGSISKGDFYTEPSIVVAASGMMSVDTNSFKLAMRWMQRKNFGIAFVGYQDPSSPGHALLNSPENKPFDLAGHTVKRLCRIERLRFSAHASREDLVDFISDVRPRTVVIVHGEPEACDRLGLALRENMRDVRILVPRQGQPYEIGADGSLKASATDQASATDDERTYG
jgi:cleavage and polyadenylation specificity factor subunit 3